MTIDRFLSNISLEARAEEVNGLFVEPLFIDGMNRETMRVLTNVTGRRQMGYVGRPKKILKPSEGCGFNSKGDFKLSTRVLDPEKLEAEFAFCKAKLQDTIFQMLGENGLNESTMTSQDLEDILLTIFLEAVAEDMERLYWFGDKSSTDGEYNFLNGLFKYLVQGKSNQSINYVDTESGTALAAGEGFAYTNAVWLNASKELKGTASENKVIKMSQDFFDRLQDDLIAGAFNSSAYADKVINNQLVPTFKGVEIETFQNWEEYGAESGLFAQENNNLIIYTTKDNLVVGTNDRAQDMEFEVWYDRSEREIRMRIVFYLGAQYVHPQFVSLGY